MADILHAALERSGLYQHHTGGGFMAYCFHSPTYAEGGPYIICTDSDGMLPESTDWAVAVCTDSDTLFSVASDDPDCEGISLKARLLTMADRVRDHIAITMKGQGAPDWHGIASKLEEMGRRIAEAEIFQVLGPLGFEWEVGGGGSLFLSYYAPSGAHVWITHGGGIGEPESDSWMLCAYPGEWDGDNDSLLVDATFNPSDGYDSTDGHTLDSWAMKAIAAVNAWKGGAA
jgi:hypothetical protein